MGWLIRLLTGFALRFRVWWGVVLQLTGLLVGLFGVGMVLGGGWWLMVGGGVWVFLCGMVVADDAK